jgi:Fe-S-cluster containining protein
MIKSYNNPNSSCCHFFNLPFSPEVLWENYQHFVINGREEDDANGHARFIDIERIEEMVRYIGYRADRFGSPGHYYTCKHISPEGVCGIYKDRPDLCRHYPNNGRCEYRLCETTRCNYHHSRFKRRYEEMKRKKARRDTERTAAEM